jgi:hypothetical protein
MWQVHIADPVWLPSLGLEHLLLGSQGRDLHLVPLTTHCHLGPLTVNSLQEQQQAQQAFY